MKNKLTREKTKTENRSTITSQVFPRAQGNNFLFSSSSKSPSSTKTNSAPKKGIIYTNNINNHIKKIDKELLYKKNNNTLKNLVHNIQK